MRVAGARHTASDAVTCVPPRQLRYRDYSWASFVGKCQGSTGPRSKLSVVGQVEISMELELGLGFKLKLELRFELGLGIVS